jgi:hypothetical protein
MPKQTTLTEQELAAITRNCRKVAGLSRAQAARAMEVSQTSVFHAEETPTRNLTNLRCRMIEAWSEWEVVGPVYILRKK